MVVFISFHFSASLSVSYYVLSNAQFFHPSLLVFTRYFKLFGFLQKILFMQIMEYGCFSSVFPEVYSEPCQTSNMEHFAKIDNYFRRTTIVDVWQVSE